MMFVNVAHYLWCTLYCVTMVTFIIQKLFKAVREGDTNALKNMLDHYPDGINITDGVCELTISIQ